MNNSKKSSLKQFFFKKLLLYLMFIGFFPFFSLNAQRTTIDTNKEKVVVEGRVVDLKDAVGISFAVLNIEELDLNVVADVDGRFKFPPLNTGSYTIKAQSLGYQTEAKKYTITKKNSFIQFNLVFTSITLKEFVVSPKFNTNQGSKAVVDKNSIEHIQPTSIADLFMLIPGSVFTGNAMNRFRFVSSRQIGADQSTSLGITFLSDGVPSLSTDAIRTQMVTSGYDRYAGRQVKNAGVDTRNISADHIQDIEIIRGIPSAKIGNMTSSAIIIKSKSGYSPLQLRVKLDPLNKLFYAGKGFHLGNSLGTLYVGADFTNAKTDIRNQLDQYSRFTFVANYSNKLKLFGKGLDIESKLSQTNSVNNTKTDVLIVEQDERYKSSYNQTALMLKGKYAIYSPYIESFEFILSGDYTRDRLDRKKFVVNSLGSMCVPTSFTEGEAVGAYLPAMYHTNYSVENNPVSLFNQINGVTRFNYKGGNSIKFIYGTELRYSKNRGVGAVIDHKLPPYPRNNSYMRPRPNYDIPAYSIFSAYLENQFRTNITEKIKFESNIGVRASKMLNLPFSYVLNNKFLFEPRINISATWVHNDMKHVLHAGYGKELKYPTLDYLYPEKIYQDFIILNAFYNDPERNHLIVNTKIFERFNNSIRENINRKKEIGWTSTYKGWDFSLSVFKEEMNRGFEYTDYFEPVSMDRYLNPRMGIVGKPQKEDFEKIIYRDFAQYTKVVNNRTVLKKGLEYRLSFPRIEAICTKFELNGAYYITDYSRSMPVMVQPDYYVEGMGYPYVGIYDKWIANKNERLNTNIWAHTHFPKYGLIFSNFLQFIWFSSEQNVQEAALIPDRLLDHDGRTLSVTDAQREDILTHKGLWKYLDLNKTDIYLKPRVLPLTIMVNFKATKELNKRAKLSFFVNKIIDFNPKYKRSDYRTDRQWSILFFGAEVRFNL